MRSVTNPKRLLCLMLCFVMMLSMISGGMASVAYAARYTNSPTGESGVSENGGIMPRGTLGGTAEKLDGDWAYLSAFEILDEPATPGVVDGILDGSGTFDTDTDPNSLTYKDRVGNDENAKNGKVRSFDTVTYKLYYVTKAYDEYDAIKAGWINYEMVLPYDPTRAVWKTESMTWIGSKVNDQAGLNNISEQTSGYFIATEMRDGVMCQVLRGKHWLAPSENNPIVIPNEGTLSAVVQVLAMEEGDTVQPSFSAWMEHNTSGNVICENHHRNEVVAFTAPATNVTAEVRLDIDISGWNSDTLSSYDFDAAGAEAPNYTKGVVTGNAQTFKIGIHLWNGINKINSTNEGRKGLMAPKSGDTITFDLTLSSNIISESGTDIPISNTQWHSLIWALGSNDDKMDWKNRLPIMMRYCADIAANTAFASYTIGDNACYNGGKWEYTIDPVNPNIIHVKVSGIEIDLTNFPHRSADTYHSYDASGVIPISTGHLELVRPIVQNDINIMDDPSINGTPIKSGTVYDSVADSNMEYNYISKKDGNPYTLLNDDQTLITNDKKTHAVYPEKYEVTMAWTESPSNDSFTWLGELNGPRDTVGTNQYVHIGGDPTVHGQKIGGFLGTHHTTGISGEKGMVVAGKSLLKFDSSAVVPTGEVTYMRETNIEYNHTVLYATKPDGSAWASDDEMKATTMTELKYYASLSDIPPDAECIGVLIEYLPKSDNYAEIPVVRQHLYADVGLKVRDSAVVDELYMLNAEMRMWNKGEYEAVGKNIPSLLGTSTIPAESWHLQPDYKKGSIDKNTGHLVGDNGGTASGDVMQVVTARSRITKEVAQQENGKNKYIYYLDSDERFVDYKLNVSTEYVTHNVDDVQEGKTTTLTVWDAMPRSLNYVPGSAYYGGEYVQSKINGRQGKIVNGTPLTMEFVYFDGGYDWYKITIPNVEIGKPLEPIYLTAEIGTRGVESTDVTDNAEIYNFDLSQVGNESTTTVPDIGSNEGVVKIKIAKNNAIYRTKQPENTYVEKGDSLNWSIKVGNNSGVPMSNTIALDVLPYIGDGFGTTCTGSVLLTKWNIDTTMLRNFSSGEWKIMYTYDEKVRGTQSLDYNDTGIHEGEPSGPKGVVFKNIMGLEGVSIDWTTGVVTLPTGFAPTAIVMVGMLPGNNTLKISVQMKLSDGKQGDIIANQFDGYPSPIYTVKRSLEGCTWIDANKDGIRQTEESMLSDVTVTLYKLKDGGNATNEADYEVLTYTDNTGDLKNVSVVTDKQIDAETGAVTDYSSGRYCFTNLPYGTYAVKFTKGATAYTGSPVNVGANDTIDSDATPSYNEDSGKMEKSVILGIVMNAANDSMNDINQESKNNDGGFYMIPRALTISKTVNGNMGDREKLFDFTITLKDADGNNINGTYNCVAEIIDGSGATAPTIIDIVFTNGSATLQLGHGQKITMQNLPNHCQYTIAETSVSGYTTTTTGDTSNDNLRSDSTVVFTNTADVITPTGILLDIWPYVLVVLLAIGGAVTFLVLRKKKKRNSGRHDNNEQR